MIVKLFISSALESRVSEIKKILGDLKIGDNHPDLIYFKSGEKLGIEQARKIKQHLLLKPFQAKGKVIVIEDAAALTTEAQNALLKTLEEPPPQTVVLLGVASESELLPTILSRCQIINLTHDTKDISLDNDLQQDISKLLKANFSERFAYIEKLKDREQFLYALVKYFRNLLLNNLSSQQYTDKEFVQELIRAEEWAAQNVNIRGILEYLMLVMPKKN